MRLVSADSPHILRDPQFQRLWVLGMAAGLIRWVEVLAYAVITYEQTQSAFWVASLMTLRMLPLALFGVSLGALAARLSRRRVLLAVHSGLFLSTLGLLLLSVFGRVEVWHLALASALSGLLWACDMPMRRGLMGDIAGHQRMAQAMSLDVVAASVCRLIGPGLGGLLIARGGLTGVFACLALIYLPGLLALAQLREPRPTGPAEPKSMAALFMGGVQAARESSQLRAALWLTILFNLFAWPVLSMVPVIGHERLHLDPQGLGLLASLEGVGSLLGALLLSLLASRLRNGLVFLGAVLSFLLLQMALAWSPQVVITGAALLALGGVQAGFGVMQATLVYTAAPEARRAEAMGLMTMCIGVSPLGFVAVGALADHLGASTAILICALCGLIGVVATWPLCRACLGEPVQAPMQGRR
jgi:MFS family permease